MGTCGSGNDREVRHPLTPTRRLGDDRCQIGAARTQQVARSGDQAADIEDRFSAFVTPHGAAAFFDAPANGALGCVVAATKSLSE